MILAFWRLGFFFPKPEKNDFEQKEAPSTNVFAIPLLISPSALDLPSLSHSVYAHIISSHSLFPFFLSSFFYFACRNSIYFVFTSYFLFAFTAVPLAVGILLSVSLPIHLPLFFQFLILLFPTWLSLFIFPNIYPLSVYMCVEQMIPPFITLFKLHRASCPWSPYLSHSVPHSYVVINNKSVLEAFSYIIASKLTLLFFYETIKKAANYQLPYGCYQITDWKPRFWRCLGPLTGNHPCGSPSSLLPTTCSC